MNFEKIHLQEVDSTNDFIHRLELNEFFAQNKVPVVSADYQTSGKGAGQNTWQSIEKLNLLMSIAINPLIKAKDQFLISKIISLSIVDLLKSYGIESHIKWPNDILVGRKKIAGILIENVVSSDILSQSIIGIGLNTNQIYFDNLPKSISMSFITNITYNLEDVQNKLLEHFEFWYNQIKNADIIDNVYISNLFGTNDFFEYKYKNDFFDAKITNVDEFGRLMLEDRNGAKFVFNFKEVDMIY